MVNRLADNVSELFTHVVSIDHKKHHGDVEGREHNLKQEVKDNGRAAPSFQEMQQDDNRQHSRADQWNPDWSRRHYDENASEHGA